MYYHVKVEATNNNFRDTNKEYFEFDKTSLEEIERRVVEPLLRKEDFQFDGFFEKWRYRTNFDHGNADNCAGDSK